MKNPGIYIILHKKTCQVYVGRDNDLGKRVKHHLTGHSKGCRYIHRAILKHGADAFHVEQIPLPEITRDELIALEERMIMDLGGHQSLGGYNISTKGWGGDPEVMREENRKRVKAGTHHWIGGKIQRKRWEDPERRKYGSKKNRESAHKLWKDPEHRKYMSKVHRKLWKDPEHRKHVSESARESALQRVKDGTHNLLGDNNWQRKKRLKAEWMWTRSLAMCWYEMNDYVMKRRAEFYDKDIPDTSNATQMDLF